MNNEITTDIWYQIESSEISSENWVSMGKDSYDTRELAEEKLERWRRGRASDTYKFRVVRKTLTTEAL